MSQTIDESQWTIRWEFQNAKKKVSWVDFIICGLNKTFETFH